MQPVDVLVTYTGTTNPVVGATVSVYSSDGVTLVTRSVTDPSGRAGFLLEEGAYSLRFFKYQVSFSQPQVAEVSSTLSNTFEVHATDVSGDAAVDPALCRVAGFFRDALGGPHIGLDIVFICNTTPRLVGDAALLQERRMVSTDKRGYACADLVRGAEYTVLIAGFDNSAVVITVPHAPKASLPMLLVPSE